jgi:3-oxoacyl-(acyl-carrier-protein) synthase
MTEVAIVGVGIWSEQFSNWDDFRAVLDGQEVMSDIALKPELIPPRERRRAPMAVKMAIEVMDQACRMAAVEPSEVASVFASGMGDMQITDYMCRTLATAPRAVSPTKFHNSVHNAATGYWSIATHSHSPANAISRR